MRPDETLLIEHINPVSGAQTLILDEVIVWQPTGDNRQLYGNLHELGVNIEWHDFELGSDTTLDWSHSFHADSLALCLNLSGHGCIQVAGNNMEFEPLTAGFYSPGKNELRACRRPGERHRFLTVELSPGFLREHLSSFGCALHDLVEQIVFSGAAPASLGDVHRMTGEQEQFVSQLQQLRSCQGARRLWYQGKVLQLMAEFFFIPHCEKEGQHCKDKLICDRQKRIARERVDRVVSILRRDFAEPPTLEKISRETGCSRFYLSRTFSRETGMTIPQYLRKLRMECAAELLKSGKCNVTEAATEVGYSSLSHFSQAFCQIMGCCPALYPSRVPAQPTNDFGIHRSVTDRSIAVKINLSMGSIPNA